MKRTPTEQLLLFGHPVPHGDGTFHFAIDEWTDEVETKRAAAFLKVDADTLHSMCDDVFLLQRDWRWKNANGSGGHKLFKVSSLRAYKEHGRCWRAIVEKKKA